MLTDDEIDEIRFRIPTKSVTQRDYGVARAVERAAYAAAIKACKPHEDDDAMARQAKLECVAAIRSLMQEQPK